MYVVCAPHASQVTVTVTSLPNLVPQQGLAGALQLATPQARCSLPLLLSIALSKNDGNDIQCLYPASEPLHYHNGPLPLVPECNTGQYSPDDTLVADAHLCIKFQC